jgi:predicted nucleotidyltransferase component of viral defense system
MIIDDLKRVVQQNQKSNQTYLLNLLKEELQNYILYFVYTNRDFKDMIFTGGTCLRRVYGLNRLSVDLDFDFESDESPKTILAERLGDWFRKEHQLKDIDIVIRKESVKVKLKGGAEIFPEMGKDVIFVSVDISPVNFKEYGVENNLISVPEFSFIVRNFDLPTMFANKINAFLGREFRFGKEQEVSFKARDVYDLFWLCQRSKQNGYNLKPNFKRIFEEQGVNDEELVLQRILDKIVILEDRQLQIQLQPFFADQEFVEAFIVNYRAILMKDLECLFA